MFSVSATKIASKATEGAIKIGGIASQKVADISISVSEKASVVECSFSLFGFSLVNIFVCSLAVRPLALCYPTVFLVVFQAAAFPREFPTKIQFVFCLYLS
jgi:hypothetical protein